MAFATALEKAVNHSLVPSKLAPDLRLYIANNAVELSWSPNNNLLALVDRDKNVLIFNSSNAQQLLNSAILRENVNHYCRKILWSPCGKYLMIKTDSSNRSEGTSHYFFDLSAKRHIFTYKDVYSLSWSDNDRFLLIEQKGTYRLIDLENYHQIT